MNATAAHPKSNISVRWPFRALAGLIVMTGVIATAGSAYIDWARGSTSPEVRLHLLLLPGALSLIRLAWHALVEGRSPETPWWPFASERVAKCYFVVMFLVLQV